MRKSKLRSKVIITLLTMAIVAVYPACGGANEAYDSMATVDKSYEYSESYSGGLYDTNAVVKEEAESTKETGTQKNDVFDERKLIKTVNMDVETKEYDALLFDVKEKVSELGGYIENLETYNGSSYSNYRSSRNASLTIRIPKEKLESFVETVSGISNVVRRSDNVEDVTLSYVDMESRRNSLQTECDRLLELLEQAENINEIIVIEERLSDVRYRLESMESQLRTIDNQVDYSTVHLDISEVQILTPVVELGPFEQIAEGFVENLRDIGEGAVDFFVWFVISIPYFVVWGAIITLIVIVIKALKKRKRTKKAAAMKPGNVTTNTEHKKED